ncbi:Ctr copper transporter [Aspergillus crustosus]
MEAHHAITNTTQSMTMSSVFSCSTRVTLFFSAWTTTSPTTYLLTLFVLFALAFLNCFLAVCQHQSRMSNSIPSTVNGVPILAPLQSSRSRMKIPEARLSPLPLYMQVDSHEGDEEEHHTIQNHEKEIIPVSDRAWHMNLWTRIADLMPPAIPAWTPNAPWSLRSDGGRALVEGSRAFVGYILMLAVMTFNVGVFCAVLSGIVISEMTLGRYTRHSSGIWHDGACHD